MGVDKNINGWALAGADRELSKGEGILCKTNVQNRPRPFTACNELNKAF